jgi:tetratricopeptide (TPR) repeat protein/predicted Ser/Thr protein kinase
MTSSAKSVQLSDDQRRLLTSWLAEFEQSWDEGRLAVRVGQLPPPGSPLRLPALGAMAQIDLRRHWQQGRRVLVETYLRAYPELGTVEAVVVGLIEAECAARQQRGWPEDWAEYVQRFPHLAEALRDHRSAHAQTPAPGADLPTQATRSVAGAGGSGPQPAAAPTLPEQFGRYRILKQLGQGGMGAVYLAYDTQLDRQVALKVPHFSGGNNAEALARFAREARAAAGLRHPNICPVYDVSETDGINFVTMAYIEGQSLADMIQGNRQLSRRAIATVVRKLAAALEEAHRLGVIHRDLKPSNIMIDKRGEPIVMDFGLARRMDQEDTRLTKLGTLLGTPAYMAPEQIDGDPEAVGPASDMYALGVILYEMLTGRVPFQGSTTAVLARILTTEPVPPSALRPRLDAEFEAICLKAMAKKPADRFASMGALAAVLGQYLKTKHPDEGGTGPSLPVLQAVEPTVPILQAIEPARPPAPPVPVAKPAVPPPAYRPRPVPPRASRRPARQRRRTLLWVVVAGCLAAVLVMVVILALGSLGHPGGAALQRGREALDKNDYETAVRELTEAIEREPTSAAAFAYRGDAYRRLRELEKSDADLTEAIRLDPALARAFAHRGDVRGDLGKDDEAWADCQEALRLDPKQALAHAALGTLHARKGNRAQALAACEEALACAANDKERAEVLNDRGIVHAANGDNDAAMADHDESIRLDPNPSWAYANRAELHIRRRQWDKALADCDEAIRRCPKDGAAYNQRGRVHFSKKEDDAALADYDEAIRLRPNASTYYCNRGDLHHVSKNLQLAFADYDKAIQLNPKNANACNGRGNVHFDRQQDDAALADYDEAIRLNPNVSVFYSNRANLHQIRRNWDQALADCDKAIGMNRNNARAYCWRGYAYLGLNDPRSAIVEFNEALRLEPGFTVAKQGLAKAQQAIDDGN